MKKVIIFSMMLVSSLTFARAVKITGLEAKAVYDTLSSVEELRDFNDAAMGGRWYFAVDEVNCSKDVTPGKEMAACTFVTKLEDGKELRASIYSDDSEKSEKLESIRFVLAEASKADKKVSENRKELKLKNLSCSSIGNRHVLDNVSIELKYECIMTK